MRNPNNPPKPVSWGEQTTDEMCIAFVGFTLDSENLQSGKVSDVNGLPRISGRPVTNCGRGAQRAP